MGYDCTLHLIDERAIREEFIPKLLRLSTATTALDRVMKNAEELWNDARAALAGDDPETAAAHVCQLAIVFSGCSLPYQYERGFALSLWADQREDVAVEYPARYAFSPQPLFAEVVRRYPALANHFPEWFEGNDTTGVFIPADRVPEVYAWVQAQVAKFEKGSQREFKGLLNILCAAAEKKLAYWEATDLAIPMAGDVAGDPSLMIAKFLGNEPATQASHLEEAPLTAHFTSLSDGIVDHWLVSGDYRPFQTNFWNLSVWPPRLEKTLGEFAAEWAPSRDGRWLLFSETNPKANERTFRPRLFRDLNDPTPREFPVSIDGQPQSFSGGGFVGEKVIAFRRPPGNAKAGDWLQPPVVLEDGVWRPIPGLPAVAARASSHPMYVKDPVIGIVPLPGGADVLIWDGNGYERRGDRFEMTFEMQARKPESQWSHAVAGDDGFFYLSNRCLFETHRGATPRPHAPKWTNIMYVRPGPAGSILLQEGDNKHGDVGKLYFPDDGTFIHIEPELFDDKGYFFIYWSRSDRFIVLGGKFLAIPSSVVLSLPRYSATTGRKVRT